ncbi:MAG: hypothetical protein IT377_33580 [Polyangiaceae bacterium]|nr:hypothetical protein [Polyangiaceae bacterium]
MGLRISREKVAAALLGTFALGAYNPAQTPLLRTDSADAGCDCGTPGAGGAWSSLGVS